MDIHTHTHTQRIRTHMHTNINVYSNVHAHDTNFIYTDNTHTRVHTIVHKQTHQQTNTHAQSVSLPDVFILEENGDERAGNFRPLMFIGNQRTLCKTDIQK